MKERLDVLLVKQGFAPSREKAKAILMSGIVYVDGQKEDKAGTMFEEEKITIEVRGATLRYVSRGGLKLEKALQVFPINVGGAVCLDIGASTGGFTDCMLQNGAAKVFAVDVGHGQLDWKLRNDPRVVCMEKTNFRYMEEDSLGEKVDFGEIFLHCTGNERRRLSGGCDREGCNYWLCMVFYEENTSPCRGKRGVY